MSLATTFALPPQPPLPPSTPTNTHRPPRRPPAQTKARLAKLGGHRNVTAVAVNAGLEEPSKVAQGGLTFYVTASEVHSSFDKNKALQFAKIAEEIQVPLADCVELWSYLPAGVPRPFYVKIDIEERHYVCVEALGRLERSRRPKYDVRYRHRRRHSAAHAPPPRPANHPPLQVHLVGAPRVRARSAVPCAGHAADWAAVRVGVQVYEGGWQPQYTRRGLR